MASHKSIFVALFSLFQCISVLQFLLKYVTLEVSKKIFFNVKVI